MAMAKATLIGNVGRDPEQRYTQTGTMTVSFSMAVNNRRRNPDGSYQDETEWYRITAAGRLAEICQQYVTKGSQLYVEGRLRVDRWTGQDGQPRTTLDVFANDVQLLGSRQQREGFEPGPAGASPAGNAPAGRSQPPDMDRSDIEDLPF
jgi:single-strand DNA-binding protein